MGMDLRQWYELMVLHHAASLLHHMNCAEYTHDNGVVSVRVARSGMVDTVPTKNALALIADRVAALIVGPLGDREEREYRDSIVADLRGLAAQSSQAAQGVDLAAVERSMLAHAGKHVTSYVMAELHAIASQQQTTPDA